MPCQPPNNMKNASRIKRWGAQLEKHHAFFTVKSLLFTTALFIAAGYALVPYLLGSAGHQAKNAVSVIQMGNGSLIFITLYFLIIEYLFKKRPQEIRLVQRFIWYLAILFIVLVTGLGAMFVSR